MINSYQPNLENMQNYLQQENERSNKGDGPNWWSIPSGMSSVRILPPWDPTGRVALPVYMHPIEYKGEGMSYTKYNWTCVNKTFNKPCPICEGLAGMSAAGVDISNWEANRRQFYFNAIVMHDPTYDPNKKRGVVTGTHVLMKAPKTVYDWVVSQITNPMIGDITSLDKGIDVYITKEGSGLGTSYNMTLSPNGRTPIPPEYLDKIDNLYNLDEIFGVGFDQKQVDELVNHLKKSSGAMGSSVPDMKSQMAGYQQSPQYQAPVSNPVPAYGGYAPNNQFQSTPPNYGVAASPFGGSSAPRAPMTPQTPPAYNPAPAQAPSANTPKCFGQYDSGNVNCVVCPVEIACSQSK